MKHTILAGALLGCMLAAHAAPAAPAKGAPAAGFDRATYAIKSTKIVLPNGLTLLVHEDHSAPVVAVNMWYHVGSRNEKRGKTGFAHLFEHFFFNGSEHHPFGFREAMDDLGASNRNGTTSTDRTNFFEDVPVSALEKTLFLEADRMGFLANYISKEMLERERGVVQNEKRQGENRPYGRVYDTMTQRLYPYSHPYSWSTIGSMDDLNAASLADIKEWYATYYGPNNAVISLAGDITPERAKELVTKYFGDIPPGPSLSRTEQWIPKLDRDIRDEMEDRVPQTRIYRAYHVPQWKDLSAQHLALLGEILSGSPSARLERRLITEKQLATAADAGVNDGEIAGSFIVSVTVKPGADPLEAEREMDRIISELLQNGPTAAEVKRAQNRRLARFLRGMERLGGMGGRSDILAESMTYGGAPDFYLKQLEALGTATPAEIKATANTWLRGYHYTMVVHPAGQLKAAKAALDRKVVPNLGAAPDIKFPQMQRAKLGNGMNVVLMERHSTPIVHATLAVDAGAASDSAAKAGAAQLTLDMLEKGTKSRDAFRIADEQDNLGANISVASTPDLSLVACRRTSANLKPSLALLADVALNPSFPADQFAIQKQRRIALLGQEKANANTLATRLLPGLLYGADHAYGKPPTGFEKTVGALSRDDLAQWHSQWFRPGSATLIVAGDTTMDKLMPALEAAFGGWKAGSAPAKSIATVPRTAGKKVYLVDKPDAPQSVIVAAHVSETAGQPEDLALEPVMTNFGGIATSRLNRNLRLDKHWSYGTSGAMLNMRGQRTFMVTAPVQTDKTKEAMVEVAKEIRGVAGERPLAGAEYESIMRNMTSRLPGRFATLASLEGAAVTSLNTRLPDDYWSQYGARMRGLNEAQLAGAATKFVRPDETIWMVIGDVRKIEAGVRELGFGQVVKLDADGNVIQ
jgi:zinc protease